MLDRRGESNGDTRELTGRGILKCIVEGKYELGVCCPPPQLSIQDYKILLENEEYIIPQQHDGFLLDEEKKYRQLYG